MNKENTNSQQSNIINAVDLMPIDEHSKSILHQRAILFSTEEKIEIKKNDNISYIRFILGINEYYGISYDYIKEIINYIKPTPVPRTKTYIAGVVNRRGNLICILDLNIFFQLKTDSYNKNSNLIIINIQGLLIGIIASSIIGINSYDREQLNTNQNYDGLIDTKYIVGLHNGNTAILNLEHIIQEIQREYSL